MTDNLTAGPSGRLVAAGRIEELAPDQVFVFGSNARGKHGSGSARTAYERFGAVWGQGHGRHSNSYAIDTMSGSDVLAGEVAAFISYATAHPDLTFLVAEIGCRKAGYIPAQVAPHFASAPANVALPESFARVIAGMATAPATNRRPRPAAAPDLTPIQLDRAVGAIVASAAGDALGAPYEFGPAHSDDFQPAFGVGPFGHEPGEWTDDTAMAIPILEAISRGESLRDQGALARVVARWLEWNHAAKDVGTQTRIVLAALGDRASEVAARDASRQLHEDTGRTAGNGSLMRTGPVALAYLRPGSERRIVEVADRIARLTHWDDDNADAVVLWSLMIRHAILTGGLDPSVGLDWIPAQRRSRWASLIDEALMPGRRPRDFREQNGWVVKAFQAALCAVAGAGNVRDALTRAIQGGGDTDTVAAIAGSLAGAVWGASQVPHIWQRKLHGWPGYTANDLARLAVLAARRGHADRKGWPRGDSIDARRYKHTAPVRHPHDDGVWLGSQNAIGELPASVNAVVSLCRVGAREVPERLESIQVWLVDADGANANLDWTLIDATDVIAELRAEGKEVFVHCAEARSRTSAVAALYGIRHKHVSHDQAWADVAETLPHVDPAPFLQAAVRRIAAGA